MCTFSNEYGCSCDHNWEKRFTLLDVNGDGAADLVGDPYGLIGTSPHADLVREMRNGRGGKVQLAYSPPSSSATTP